MIVVKNDNWGGYFIVVVNFLNFFYLGKALSVKGIILFLKMIYDGRELLVNGILVLDFSGVVLKICRFFLFLICEF